MALARLRRTLIPWYLFRQALDTQPQYNREHWLTYWYFADIGVSIFQDESGIKDVVTLLFPHEKGEVIH